MDDARYYRLLYGLYSFRASVGYPAFPTQTSRPRRMPICCSIGRTAARGWSTILIRHWPAASNGWKRTRTTSHSSIRKHSLYSLLAISTKDRRSLLDLSFAGQIYFFRDLLQYKYFHRLMPGMVQTETARTNLLHRKAKAERVNRPSTLRHEYGTWALAWTTSASYCYQNGRCGYQPSQIHPPCLRTRNAVSASRSITLSTPRFAVRPGLCPEDPGRVEGSGPGEAGHPVQAPRRSPHTLSGLPRGCDRGQHPRHAPRPQ